MKKLFALTLALLMIVCTLAACGDSSADNNKTDSSSAASVDLSALMDQIVSQYQLDGLKRYSTTAEAKRYYTVAEEDVKQFAAVTSAANSKITEVIIFEAADSAAADRIEPKLSSHLDSQVNTAKSYSKDTLSMVESSTVIKSGNFVYLVIHDNADAINAIIESAIK